MKLFTQKSRTCEYGNVPCLPRGGVLFPNSDDGSIADITLALCFEREQYLPGLDITGGRYAALSLDNCFGCTIEGATIDPRASRHGILIADHSDGNWIDSVLFDSHARGADIVIGWRPGLVPSSDWNAAGINVLRDVKATDGKPVRVHVWNAPPPVVEGGNVEIRIMNPRFVRAAQWLNRKGLLP
jgi:hypothetical protein